MVYHQLVGSKSR